MICKCSFCNKSFNARTKRKFCTHSCYAQSLIGKPTWNTGKHGEYKLWPNGRTFSDETKKKMSLAKIGKPLNPLSKEKMLKWRKNNPDLAHMNFWLGKKQPREMVKKRIRSGQQHYNWKGGISKNKYPTEFNRELKLKIRTRDKFTCCICGRTEEEERVEFGRVLSVNHIDFDKNNCKPYNLNTLCLRCNIRINYARDIWTKYFNNKPRTHYISGKITDPDPDVMDANMAKFFVVEEKLKAEGHEVFNPASQGKDGTWEYFIARDLLWLFEHRPDMYFMSGWEDSRGARLEHEVAKHLKLKITYETENGG